MGGLFGFMKKAFRDHGFEEPEQTSDPWIVDPEDRGGSRRTFI